MARMPVSREELLGVLNKELLQDPENEDCKVRQIRKLRRPYPGGSNWDVSSIGASGRDVLTCFAGVAVAVKKVRARYNLE